MTTEPRLVCITTGPSTYLDHLGVLSLILDIPLIVTEEELYHLFSRYYPKGQLHYIPHAELSFEVLATHFDVILQSGRFWYLEMKDTFELLFQKKMRFVFCPHGNSDKGFSATRHAPQDIALYYGQHMLELLHKTEALSHIHTTIRTGNYRYTFYKEHQMFYDKIVEQEILPHLFKEKKTILYAPTWQDGESPTSFFSSTSAAINQLKESFNIIIKLHPLLTQFHPAETEEVLSRLGSEKGVLVLKEFPPIYPLLDLCSIYLGDFSSIGYDFLLFNKPMFFLSASRAASPLDRCGIHISDKDLFNIKGLILQNIHSDERGYTIHRQNTYQYAFGEDKTYQEIKKELQDIAKEKKLKNPANCWV